MEDSEDFLFPRKTATLKFYEFHFSGSDKRRRLHFFPKMFRHLQKMLAKN